MACLTRFLPTFCLSLLPFAFVSFTPGVTGPFPCLLILAHQFQCFCAKNWKETVRCRVYGERHSTFPFNCSLSQLLRAKRLLHGLSVAAGAVNRSVTVRERTFLDNPNVPDTIKVGAV